MSDAGSDPRPFELAEAQARQHAPATLRNREPIADALKTILPPTGLVLEIASGTGEHAVHFAKSFPAVQWQPTDMSEAALASIDAWRAEVQVANLRSARKLDLIGGEWPVAHADAIFCANMAHIAPWETTVGLFDGAEVVLAGTGPLVLYGPFIEEGVETAPSNLAFDANLKARDPRWGIRTLGAMSALAAAHGLSLSDKVAMPANNLLLVYRRP